MHQKSQWRRWQWWQKMEAAVQGTINRPNTGPLSSFPCWNITNHRSRLILSGSALTSPKLRLVKIWRERGGVRTALEAAVAEYGGSNVHRWGGGGGRSVIVWMWILGAMWVVSGFLPLPPNFWTAWHPIVGEAVTPLLDSSHHFCHGFGCTAGRNC